MSDEGNANGQVIDSPTPNSYVVGVSIVEGETAPVPKPVKGKTVTPEEPNPQPEPDPEPEPNPPA